MSVLKIMFLGTGSDVGKSITATAFCKILSRKGYKTAPFKAQNMSNNSFVTLEGGEIGRAQVAQAEACGQIPSVHMNPVLLKPSSDMGSQVILQGRVFKNLSAANYYALKPEMKLRVMESYDRLAGEYEAIVMEGAGSCAEVNLREHDIVNFEMALATETPVVLVADIDKGGVFAQIIGSLELISKQEKDLVKGFIINKFRGDPSLFKTGIEYIEEKTGKPVFGLVPWFTDFKIDSEDSMSLDNRSGTNIQCGNKINIAAVRLPHISNFTDLEVFETEPQVCLSWLDDPTILDNCDILIIPGTKSVIYDMKWLYEKGFKSAITEFAKRKNTIIIGVCGGYQMLGKSIHDNDRIEGSLDKIEGLGLLDIRTEIEPVKTVQHSTGVDNFFHTVVHGYEIHMGKTFSEKELTPFINLKNPGGAGDETDGVMDSAKNIFGTYFHGFFDSGIFRKNLIEYALNKKGIQVDPSIIHENYQDRKNMAYDKLADHFIKYTDVDKIINIMKGMKQGLK